MTARSDDARAYFAERIARLQGARRLSDEALAKRAKLDVAEVREMLRGEGTISVESIFLLGGALGVAPGELLDGVEWVPDGKGGGEYRIADPEDS